METYFWELTNFFVKNGVKKKKRTLDERFGLFWEINKQSFFRNERKKTWKKRHKEENYSKFFVLF